MSGPYDIKDAFTSVPIEPWMQVLRCPDPENCTEMHNENEDDNVPHHYGCDCPSCQYEMWCLKH